MRQFEINKTTLLKYGISEDLIDKIIAKGFTKTKLEIMKNEELKKVFLDSEIDIIKERLCRQPIPDNIYNRLVQETELHCPFCWNLKEDPPIVIHHIGPYNETQDNSYNNLIVLCLNHHGEVHTKREISQNNYPRIKLLTRKEEWIEALKEFKAGNRAAPGVESELFIQKSKIDILQNFMSTLCTNFRVESLKNKILTIKTNMQGNIADIFNKIKCNETIQYYEEVEKKDNTLGAMLKTNNNLIIIEQYMKTLINEYALANEMKIDETFFNLGQLRKGISSIFYDTDGLNGKKEEKEKYKLIEELYKGIRLYKYWSEYEKLFFSYSFINLVLSNNGSTYDEDIEVKLFF